MEVEQKIKEIDDQLRVLKSEVKQTLVDIREEILTRYRNPFSVVQLPPKSEVTAFEKEPSREEEKPETRDRERGGAPTGVKETLPPPAFHPPDRRKEYADGSMDLTTVAGLTQWAGNSMRKVGKKRVESIVEVYEMSGLLPAQFKEILLRLIDLADGEEPEGRVTVKDCIAVFVQLDSILGRGYKPEAAVLSILLNDEREASHR